MAVDRPKDNVSGKTVPDWFPKAGAIIGSVTLLFLMLLVIASIAQHPPNSDTRPLVIFVLALGMALSFAFVGGSAAAEGMFPVPFVRENPIKFSVTGGFAAFIITVALGFQLYGGPASFHSSAPRLLSPGTDERFDAFPRNTAFVWEAVSGATKYKLEVEYFNGVWIPLPLSSGQLFTTETRANVGFPGANPGRWRVTALNSKGESGQSSEWRMFSYSK
jgi:hypothetical protein